TTFHVDLIEATPTILSDESLEELRNMELVSRAMRILYIEDNQPNIALMRHVIATRPEWQLDVAETGQKGLDNIYAERPDLLLLDLDLPDIQGSEILRR